MNVRRNLCLAAIALTTLLPLSPASSAELQPGMRTEPVSLAGVDLRDPKQVGIAYSRLRVAAQSVCKNLYTLELGQRRAKWDRCVEGALAQAIADINAPALTAYSQSKSGKKPALVAREP